MAGLIGEEALLMAQKVWQLMSKGKGYEKSLQQVSERIIFTYCHTEVVY